MNIVYVPEQPKRLLYLAEAIHDPSSSYPPQDDGQRGRRLLRKNPPCPVRTLVLIILTDEAPRQTSSNRSERAFSPFSKPFSAASHLRKWCALPSWDPAGDDGIELVFRDKRRFADSTLESGKPLTGWCNFFFP